MIKEEFHLVTQCPTCGVPADLWLTQAPMVDLSAVPPQDETSEEVDLECEECGEIFLMTIRANQGGWSVFHTDDPDKKGTFEHLDYGYEEWLEGIEPEPEPGTIFRLALNEWSDLVHTLGDRNDGGSGINRMLFMQLFAIVEAYMSDEIIRLAFDYPEIAKDIVIWNVRLAKEPVTLRAVAENPDMVKDKVISSLRKMQYHNFQAVEGLTFATLNHHILPQGEENREKREALTKSVIWRHHCVHRNGRDMDGNILNGIDVDYLDRISAIMSDMVADLSRAARDYAIDKILVKIDDDDDGLPF